MSTSLNPRLPRRAVVAATALALVLSTPLAASAATADDPSLPQLDDASDSAGAAEGARFLPDDPAPVTRQSSENSARAADAPAAVEGVTATEVTSTDAHLTWAPPADNGSAITGYHLQLLIGGTVIDEVMWDTASTGATIFDLQPDTTYDFRVAAINAVGAGPFSEELSFTTTHTWVERQFGADRFETAVRVSQSAFPYEGVPVTFVANGLNFPDALAAAAAAGSFGGPVLLTRPDSVSQATVDEVEALKPEYLLAAGGSAVVSNSVLSKLSPYATESDRAAGTTRYETAGIISTLWEAVGTVYLANGTDFPDALAGAAAAGYNGAPVLLTRQGELPPETAAYLREHRPSKLVVLGGSGAVSENVLAQAQIAASGSIAAISRMSGASRYDTAVEISRQTFASPRVPVVYVASGQNFADALAGAAAAGALGGPVLLTEPTKISNATIAEIERLDPVRVIVLGGRSVVSPGVYDKIEDAID